jgi:hypothetical protein
MLRSAFLNRTVWVGSEVMSCRKENRLRPLMPLTSKLQCFFGTSQNCCAQQAQRSLAGYVDTRTHVVIEMFFGARGE